MPAPTIPALEIGRYSYDLPADRIAEFPLGERDSSRLLHYNGSTNEIVHRGFTDIPSLLPEHSLLVLNSTRVIAARLLASKPTGGMVEVLLIDPLEPSADPMRTLQERSNCVWACLVGGRNVHVGMVLSHPEHGLRLIILERNGTTARVQLQWQGACTLAELLDEIGKLPLPPYIHREVEEVDTDRYQTVYAREQGSVAAPTAGLHFTDRVFNALAARNVKQALLTLHVGLGTFQPVTVSDAREHRMHAERFDVSRKAIAEIAHQANSESPWITVVGTTSLRTLESLLIIGAKLCAGRIIDPQALVVDQWDAFDESLHSIDRASAFAALERWMSDQDLTHVWGQTHIMLAPGCRIASADALITNFHQPGNTLMLLVAAFVGAGRWRAIYDSALCNNYRFLSYGDSSLLVR